MTYAITGSTGHLGRIVIQKLKSQLPPESILALARNLAKAEDLGVPTREFDYAKPELLDSALEGVDVLLLISSNEIGQRQAQHANVLEAAAKAGVKRVIYTSLLHADTSPLNLAPEHIASEEAVKASGIPYTILRNGWYTENFESSIGGAVASGALLGSAGEGKISAATREDFAKAAVAVLLNEGHEGKTYELAGDEGYTLSDLAAEISRQTGKDIPYKNLPEAEYAAILASFGLPKDLAAAIASWDTGAAEGALFDDGKQLSTLIGHPTTPLAVTVASVLQQAA